MAKNNPDVYKSKYSATIDSLVNKAINREPFSYDPATDAAYQSYARQYTRLGDQASQDTLADVAANTGGLASSYAVTAAQQARNDYNQQLADKIPELMETAYNRYRDEYNDTLAGISTLQGLDDSAYNQFSTDRGFALDKQTAEFERMLNTWTTMGKASSEVAKYFGIKPGTRTSDAEFKAAELALERAKFAASLRNSGGGGGGGRRSGRGRGGRWYGNGNGTSTTKGGKGGSGLQLAPVPSTVNPKLGASGVYRDPDYGVRGVYTDKNGARKTIGYTR